MGVVSANGPANGPAHERALSWAPPPLPPAPVLCSRGPGWPSSAGPCPSALEEPWGLRSPVRSDHPARPRVAHPAVSLAASSGKGSRGHALRLRSQLSTWEEKVPLLLECYNEAPGNRILNCYDVALCRKCFYKTVLDIKTGRRVSVTHYNQTSRAGRSFFRSAGGCAASLRLPVLPTAPGWELQPRSLL